MTEEQFAEMRRHMVMEIVATTVMVGERLGSYNLDPRVMDAMGSVKRHEFVPVEIQPYAYMDRPLPIGYDKTISQPFIVALMTDLLEVGPEDTVLEIGTGMGYQSAVLAALAHKVCTIELIEPLAQQAVKRIAGTGMKKRGNPHRQRLQRLAGARALRPYHRHRRSRPDPRIADQPAQVRRPHGRFPPVSPTTSN